MAIAGYSGTPLPKKLGLKDGQRAFFMTLPAEHEELAGAAEFVTVKRSETPDGLDAGSFDVALAFFTESASLASALPAFRRAIAPNGLLWVSWPKRASRVPTDITEDVIRSHALPIGLVDVKVCAVDETWSGLKLVIRKELR